MRPVTAPARAAVWPGLPTGTGHSLAAIFVLAVASFATRTVSAIDPQERVGTCKKLHLNATHHIFVNEGVWFPQYRSLDSKDHTKGNNYSCHVVYEKVYVDEGEPAKLESDSYYTLNKKVVKEPYTSSYDNTNERGKLETDIHIKDHGEFRIYNYILAVTPEYRVRYLCTDFQKTIPGVETLYIETRKTVPSRKTIKEAHNVLLKHGFKTTMVKINQKKCKRPINMKGYVSMWSENKS